MSVEIKFVTRDGVTDYVPIQFAFGGAVLYWKEEELLLVGKLYLRPVRDSSGSSDPHIVLIQVAKAFGIKVPDRTPDGVAMLFAGDVESWDSLALGVDTMEQPQLPNDMLRMLRDF